MKTSILTAIAVLGLAASPALASTATSVKATRATTHRTVAQVCSSQRAMAKAKKESWKLASQNCNAAKRQARLALKQAHTAAKAAKKG